MKRLHETLDSLGGETYRKAIFSEYNVLSGVLKLDVRQEEFVLGSPPLSRISMTVTKEKGLKSLLDTALVRSSIVTGTDQVPNRLVCWLRNYYRCQLACPMKPR
jgi:hypothetical protein